MRVFRSIEEARAVRAALPGPLWVTLGTFDGLHRGHRELIRDLRAKAGPGGTSVVVTFEIHPQTVLAHDPPKPLLRPPHKLALLEEMGVDVALVLAFDERLSLVEPEAFVRDWLHAGLGARGVVLGYDNRFGHRARGDFQLLGRVAAELGMEAIRGPRVEVDDAAVSSTRIREALGRRDLDAAAQLLGRPFSAMGPIVEGHRRGRTIGFPTANIEMETDFVLPTGVYGVRVRRIDRGLAPSGTAWGVANLGYRPTVVENAPTPTLEAHLLDFDGDLYGQELEIEFLTAIREEQKFPSIDALVAQIGHDRDAFRRWVAAHEPPGLADI